jgi:hypothetical protein
MKSLICKPNNEQGSVLVVSLILLVLLTTIGISASRTTSIELQIAGNEKAHKQAFYTAEAARGYVTQTPSLYGTDNITVGGMIYFPDNADSSQKQTLSASQSFNGSVEYLGSFKMPRGSGFEAGKFKAHKYKGECTGYGPSNAQSNVGAGFYRVGF